MWIGYLWPSIFWQVIFILELRNHIRWNKFGGACKTLMPSCQHMTFELYIWRDYQYRSSTHQWLSTYQVWIFWGKAFWVTHRTRSGRQTYPPTCAKLYAPSSLKGTKNSATVKPLLFTRTLFSRKFVRPVTRQNKVHANISHVSIIVQEMNNHENKVSWINPKSWARENKVTRKINV